jgi:hypothetical protein
VHQQIKHGHPAKHGKGLVHFDAHSKLPLPDIDGTVFDVRLPNTGFLEVKLDSDQCTTRVYLDFEEYPVVKYVDYGHSITFPITKSQMLHFQLLNVPSNDAAYETNVFSPDSGFTSTRQGWQTDEWDFTLAEGGVLQLRYRYVPLQLDSNGHPLIVCAGGQGPYTGPFERGFCSTTYCGDSGVESWVRGRADLNPANGQIAILLELETDALDAGPKGIMKAIFKDADGKTLATVKSSEVGVGGKVPGRSRIENIPASGAMPVNLAGQVASIEIQTTCTGYVQKWFNLFPGALELKYSIDF